MTPALQLFGPRVDVEPVRFSLLKEIEKSGQHYLHALTAGRKDTAPMRVGRAVHSIALGGAPVVEYPERRAGEAWEEFQIEHAGAEILSSTEYSTAMGATESLARHRDAMELIEGARLREHQFAWRRGGFRCGGRADFIAPGRYVGDLKMTRSAHPERFARQALAMSYHAQLSWYGFGLEQIGIATPEKYLISVENVAPYLVVVRRLTPRAIDRGGRLCTLWLEQLRGCVESGKWPGYAETTLDLDADAELELQFGDDEDELEAA